TPCGSFLPPFCPASSIDQRRQQSPVNGSYLGSQIEVTMSDFLSGISNLTKQISNNIPYQIKKLGESVHTMVMNYTEAENIVYEATNEDPWGPTGPQMKEIANCTFQYDGFNQVTNLLWKRMLEDNKTAWRRVYKSLMLLNYLLLHGSERVIGNARDHMFQMRALEQYKFIDERGRDQGLNVRHRVKTILELLGDDDKLRAQRKKVKSDNKDRYQGYTSEDIRMGRAAPCGGASNSFHDDWKDDTSDNYKDKTSFDSNKDDYSSKEVNSFQFPDEARRGSVSPELGFRQDPAPEDDFGDFASARSIPQPVAGAETAGIGRATGPTIPALRPPAPACFGAKASSASADLLGLDTSNQSVPSVPTLDLFGATVQATPGRQPRALSGGDVRRSENPIPNDLLTVTSDHATSTKAFIDDWSITPAPKDASHSLSDFASFDAFSTLAPLSPITSTPSTTPVYQQCGFGGAFSNLSVSNSGYPSSLSSAKSTSATEEKPANPTKIGSTWAGASSLIDFDNLASKSTPIKQGLSLKEMQMNKQTNNQYVTPW
ncbi:hypothetical protein Angca_006940, partial [Angiostrongylus cantonensis]